jgi:crotonobetainyl-CoA:carnitine CoA-transferase CaiB-like acyl-CoA transferase
MMLADLGAEVIKVENQGREISRVERKRCLVNRRSSLTGAV